METPNEALVTGGKSKRGEPAEAWGRVAGPQKLGRAQQWGVGPGELAIDLCWAPLTLGSSCLPAAGSLG